MNLALYLVIGVGLNLLFFYYAHLPLENLLIKHTPAWLSISGQVLLWLVQIVIGLIFMLFSIRVSLMLMEFWYEALAARVVYFSRGKPKGPSIKMRLVGLVLMVPMILKEIGIMAMLVFVSFIPVLGAITVFLSGSYLMGKMIIEPYEAVIEGMGDKRDLTAEGKVKPFFLGLFPMILTLIPIIGWAFLPVYMVLQVIGLAWAEEN